MFEVKRSHTFELSLRSMVDKWLTPASVGPIRVERVCRAHDGRARCVRVEAARPAGPISLLFFRHDDGVWRVFPPVDSRPALRAWVDAA